MNRPALLIEKGIVSIVFIRWKGGTMNRPLFIENNIMSLVEFENWLKEIVEGFER